MGQRLFRAKQKVAHAGIPFRVPPAHLLPDRLPAVLHVLYLLFNEGYKASSGERLVREELCHEAIRLATLLVDHPAGDQPRTHALLALMLLNAARLPTRVDRHGNLLRLKEQDRSQWNQAMIRRGMVHLGQSASGDELSEFHLQAAIAACHATAPDYDATDWPRILSLYDRLAALDRSPVIALNRAVAVANVWGPAAGIEAVNAIQNRSELDSYHLLYAVLGELEAELGNVDTAARHFRRALELTRMRSEQVFLSRRLSECDGRTRASLAAIGKE
jgi:RNA polymerase sigma-70 factor (ECF subfamily)